MDLNVWNGIGRLVKDPEFVPAGATGDPHICFTLAVNRVVPRASGPKADYFPCTYWGKDAKELLGKLAKGNEIFVMGRIYTDMVQGKGMKREFFWEIRVEEIQTGREALKNMLPPAQTGETEALSQLHREFEE